MTIHSREECQVVAGLQDEVAAAISVSVVTRAPYFMTVVFDLDLVLDEILLRASNDLCDWPTMAVFRGRDWSGKPWCVVVVNDAELEVDFG